MPRDVQGPDDGAAIQACAGITDLRGVDRCALLRAGAHERPLQTGTGREAVDGVTILGDELTEAGDVDTDVRAVAGDDRVACCNCSGVDRRAPRCGLVD